MEEDILFLEHRLNSALLDVETAKDLSDEWRAEAIRWKDEAMAWKKKCIDK